MTQIAPLQSSPENELDLSGIWQAYHVSKDESLRNRLLVHYLPRARMIARHLASRLPGGNAGGADVDDLIQAATLGLRDAIATFDPSRGIKFEHYCGPRVRGAALDFLRSLDWAPRMLRSRLQRVQEMTLQLEMQNGTAPSDEEVSSALNMPFDEFQATRREAAAPIRLRLDDHSDADSEGGSRGTVNLENIPDDHPMDPTLEAQRADIKEFLLKGLGRVERLVTMLYYYDSMSFKEIGEALDLCESRVSQIHQGVLARLRDRAHRLGGTSLED